METITMIQFFTNLAATITGSFPLARIIDVFSALVANHNEHMLRIE